MLFLKTQGVIEGKEPFKVTSQHVPMIGNEISLTSIEDLNKIYGINDKESPITLGESIIDGQEINISIEKFFASHIGIFGNTGSGKSNTLHKLYLELFRSKYREGVLSCSQFFLIDFNGEYTGEGLFGLEKDDKRIFNVNTRQKIEQDDKIPIKSAYIFDADILAILFDARPATQVPFLRKAMNY
jgi:hypothetical protein